MEVGVIEERKPMSLKEKLKIKQKEKNHLSYEHVKEERTATR